MIAVEHLNGEQVVLEKRLASLEFRGRRLSALDGGLSVVSDLLVDLQSTVTLAANTGGVTKSEREGYQTEVDSILKTLDHLQNTYTFNHEYLLRGALGSQTGAVWVENSDPEKKDAGPQLVGLEGLRRGGAFDMLSGDMEKAQEVVKGAVDAIASRRAATGGLMRSIEAEQGTVAVQLENVAGAKSQILDTDYAAEVGTLVRAQVLQKAAMFAVMTARQISAQNALALLG